jgi:hypothetical protein
VTWELQSVVPVLGDDFGADAISFVDSLNGWAFGSAVDRGIITEAIYRTSNGGVSWYRESIGLTDDLGGLNDGVMVDLRHGWAVAGDGRVLAYGPVTGVAEQLAEAPAGFALRQNYPNPFNPRTVIEYELDTPTRVVLVVTDVSGKEVRRLVESYQERGVYRVEFDGRGLASGTYYCSLEAGTRRQTRSMVLVR